MKNKTIVIGSFAISYWYPEYSRTINDIDYVVRGQQGIFIDELSKRQEVHSGTHWNYLLDNNKHSYIADPDMLYTIKVSHLAWDINFDKHMKDVIFLKSKGCKLVPKLYNILYKQWEIQHGSKTNISLNGYNEDFFNSNISRKFIHDELHLAVAFGSRPLHESIREDLNSPLPSKRLWKNLSHDAKLKCALEEIYVIYLERFSKYPVNHGTTKALKQLITTMTKGWFNLFLIENFEELRNYPKDHLLSKINTCNLL